MEDRIDTMPAWALKSSVSSKTLARHEKHRQKQGGTKRAHTTGLLATVQMLALSGEINTDLTKSSGGRWHDEWKHEELALGFAGNPGAGLRKEGREEVRKGSKDGTKTSVARTEGLSAADPVNVIRVRIGGALPEAKDDVPYTLIHGSGSEERDKGLLRAPLGRGLPYTDSVGRFHRCLSYPSLADDALIGNFEDFTLQSWPMV